MDADRAAGRLLQAGAVALLVMACAPAPEGGTVGPGDPTPTLGGANLSCTIPQEFIIEGGPGVDGIPALSNPTFVSPSSAGATYLRDADRVIGLVVDGEPLAVPINILWWHEIANLTVGSTILAVTHCPLTGSSLTFVRSVIRSAELGVSGLLFMNNLLMYDRSGSPSLWPQMSRGARCGPATGTALPMYPSFEMTWGGWRSLYPSTRVVSSQTGFSRNYRLYPYDRYDEVSNPEVVGPMPETLDRRRLPKERVLGIPASDSGGIAVPFGVLDSLGPVAVAEVRVRGAPAVVFWDRDRRAATAFHPRSPSGALTFRVEDGSIIDVETSSTWRVDGVGVSGPLAGTKLDPVVEAFVAYWFAWAAFYPDTELWLGPGSVP